MAMRKPKAQGKENTPPINASSKEEEAFIKWVVTMISFDITRHFAYRGPQLTFSFSPCSEFLKSAEQEEKKAKQ